MMRTIIVWTGGIALIAAAALDGFAVLGRNLGHPIIGSIELVQVAILVSGTTAILLATLDDNHAQVRLMRARMKAGAERIASLVEQLAGATMFALLAWGSIWLAIDLWGSHESSELLGVPWRGLRLIANAGLVACILINIARLLGIGRR